MANEEHVKILKQGGEAWNKWRLENPNVKPDLREADFSGANLRRLRRGEPFVYVSLKKANLRGADLRGANLLGADLAEADLSRTDLIGATLRKANLGGADLTGATVSNATLCEAYLAWTILSHANLRGADMTKCVMRATVVAGVDLSRVKGLETIEHEGPSTIGIDTIYRSGGNIPEVFLRGCGVSDDFIATIKAIAGGIQFYSCFISYSSKDQEFATRLYIDLQSNGVRCWFAPDDIQGGKKLHEQLDIAIRVHEKLLLILSPHSMNSEWVKTEIATAREREVQEKKQVLFPIRLVDFETIRKWKCFDSDRGKDSAREIREYFIPDFSNWTEPASYRKAFDRLLRDLNADGKTESAAQE